MQSSRQIDHIYFQKELSLGEEGAPEMQKPDQKVHMVSFFTWQVLLYLQVLVGYLTSSEKPSLTHPQLVT